MEKKEANLHIVRTENRVLTLVKDIYSQLDFGRCNILKRVPNSALWLLRFPAAGEARLRARE